MKKSKAMEEKRVHDDLLDLLREHFFEDEAEIAEDEGFDAMKPMSKMMGLKKGRKGKSEDMEYEGEDESYEDEGEDDDYYDDVMEDSEEEEDDDGEDGLSKEKRKNIAVVLATKKAGRAKG